MTFNGFISYSHAADGRLMEATLNIHGGADRFAYALRLGAPEEGA